MEIKKKTEQCLPGVKTNPIPAKSTRATNSTSSDEDHLVDILKKAALEEMKLYVLESNFKSLSIKLLETRKEDKFLQDTCAFKNDMDRLISAGFPHPGYYHEETSLNLTKIRSLKDGFVDSLKLQANAGKKALQMLETFGEELKELAEEKHKLTVYITQTMEKVKKMNTVAEKMKENVIQQSLKKMEDGQTQLLEEKHLQILNKIEEMNDISGVEKKQQTELLQKMAEQMSECLEQKDQLGLLINEVREIGDITNKVNTLYEIIPNAENASDVAKFFRDIAFIFMLPMMFSFFVVLGVLILDDDEFLL